MRRLKGARSRRHPHALAASGRDGSVEFKLTRRPSGLYVERLQQRRGAGRVQHTMRFADEAGFVRWCQSDRLQFVYPVLYANLKRTGCALLCEQPSETIAA